jgi:lysophospholipase L1-like esterase
MRSFFVPSCLRGIELRVLAPLAAVALLQVGALTQTPSEHWVGTWATAPVARPTQPGGPAAPAGRGGTPPALVISNKTLRQIVHVSLGGDRVRVVFSNAFGTAPLAIGQAQVGLREGDSGVRAGTGRPLTFNGSQAATIPPGALLLSDPATLTVPPLSDLAIDLYLPNDVGAASSPLTLHNAARQTSYVSAAGNHVGQTPFPGEATTTSWFFMTRVDVTAPAGTGAIVTFGDSITDGFGSTIDANRRWPNYLARRLRAANGRVEAGILNLGIDGNRVLVDGSGVSALARFDRDVLAQAGATHVVILEGINDLGMARQGPRPTVADLQAGHRQLMARARARGLKVIGATLLPYEGTTFTGYYSEDGDTVRRAFNEWMRTGGAYDGVIDFDAVVRDPAQPGRMRASFNSGDWLHPNDAGYEAMANAVDLALFRPGAVRAAQARPLIERPAAY